MSEGAAALHERYFVSLTPAAYHALGNAIGEVLPSAGENDPASTHRHIMTMMVATAHDGQGLWSRLPERTPIPCDGVRGAWLCRVHGVEAGQECLVLLAMCAAWYRLTRFATLLVNHCAVGNFRLDTNHVLLVLPVYVVYR